MNTNLFHIEEYHELLLNMMVNDLILNAFLLANGEIYHICFISNECHDEKRKLNNVSRYILFDDWINDFVILKDTDQSVDAIFHDGHAQLLLESSLVSIFTFVRNFLFIDAREHWICRQKHGVLEDDWLVEIN